MSVQPIYWTILLEIALVLIGVLVAAIVVILKDRNNLKSYIDHLKNQNKKLKKKLSEKSAESDQERLELLLKELIDHLHEKYQNLYGNEIGTSIDSQEQPSVDKFILLSTYQTLVAELSALENSIEPEATWEKIKQELSPLYQNYLQSSASAITVDAGDSSDDIDTNEHLKEQLENAHKRIENLEKFKKLYFDLQDKLRKSVEEIEELHDKIEQLSEGSANFDDIRALIEKNKTQFIHMGQMIGMEKEEHHESVAQIMDYSDELMNERKDEIRRLKHQVSQQFEEIFALQSKLKQSSGTSSDNSNEVNKGFDTISRQLKDAEMCIETMDMEIQTLMSEVSSLRNQVADKEEPKAEPTIKEEEHAMLVEEKDKLIARFAQESKELMGAITTLEDKIDEKTKTVEKLKEKLAESSDLEEKYVKLQSDYNDMEEKYLSSL